MINDAEAPAAARAHSLQCMEVWGDNRILDDAISAPGLDAWVLARPFDGASEGGDIHYVSMCGSGRFTRLAIADVSGHGASVAGTASSLRTLMRRHINTPDMTRFMRALNTEFAELSRNGVFATAILVTYYSPTDHLILCNAGHPRPFLWRAATGAWTRITPDMPGRADRLANLPLGVIEPTSYEQFAIPLAKNDVVVLYTDALSEARGADGRMIGEDGLRATLESMDATRPDTLASDLVRFLEERQGSPLDDDVTVMVLHHNGGNPGKPSAKETALVLGKLLGLVKY